MESEACQYCGMSGAHSPECPTQFKASEDDTAEKEKTRTLSDAEVKGKTAEHKVNEGAKRAMDILKKARRSFDMIDEEIRIKSEAKLTKDFREQAVVNGIEINIHWDEGYNDFVIYFPQIEGLSEEAEKQRVPDQVIRSSRRPEDAEQVFDYAKQLAETEKDVYKLYKKVEDYIRVMPKGWKED